MKLANFLFALCCALGLSAAHAGAQVEVNFIAPENFTDIKNHWLRDESVLGALAEHIKLRGQESLPDGRVLHVDITDIDLAGEIDYTRHMSEIRVMRRVTSPRINLRWRIESADQPPPPMTEVVLRDMAYLDRINHFDEGDPLRYEKQMLDDWFYRTVAPAK